MSNYPFRLPNYKHQQREFDLYRDADARALLWQMRTGKTKSVLDLLCYRHADRGDVDALLIIAPNGVHVNWVRRQLPLHMWEGVQYNAHAWQASEAHKPSHGQSLERCLSTPRGQLAVLAVNSESIIHDKPAAVITKFLRRRRVMLVVDESHDFRSPGSRRTKRVRALKNYCSVRRILTGTAVSNSPLAAYSQFGILADKALGFQRFSEFEARYAQFETKITKGGKPYQELQQYINLDELQERIAEWASVVLRADVDDMPELLRYERTIALSDAHMEAYRKMAKELLLELENGAEVQALNGGAKIVKLQQILSGFAVDTAGELQEIVPDDANPRLRALMEELEGCSGKAIVWCKYREDIRRVRSALSAAGIRSVEYHGAVHSQAARQEAIDRFMTDDSTRVFVGQPKAGGSGLDLSAAELVLWYSHTFDAIERQQADERATQIGGRSIGLCDFVVPGTVDEYILRTLADKRSVSEDLAGPGLRDRLAAMLRSQL